MVAATAADAVIENTVSPHRDGLTVYPDLLAAAGYVPYLFGKTHFKPVPDSFAVVDGHRRAAPAQYARTRNL